MGNRQASENQRHSLMPPNKLQTLLTVKPLRNNVYSQKVRPKPQTFRGKLFEWYMFIYNLSDFVIKGIKHVSWV